MLNLTMNNSHKQTLTRACIRDTFHQKLGLSLERSSLILESILDELTGLIVKNDCVKILSFGTFLIHTKKERIGRNPKTKIETTISPRKSVSFRPASALRDKVDHTSVKKQKTDDKKSPN
jgi:integration host factor subunit alpha